MRKLLLTTAITTLAGTAFADDFAISSEIDKVTVYPSGATIERSVEFDVPAGRHVILLDNIPRGINADSLRVSGGGGLTIGAIGFRDTRLPPDEREIAARKEVEDKIEAHEEKMRETRYAMEAIQIEISAALAKVKFLESFNDSEASDVASIPPSDLTSFLDVIGAQTLSALQTAQDAKIRKDEIAKTLDDQKEELAKLQQELEAVSLPVTDRVIVSLDVTATEATSGNISVSYISDYAGWEPVYDLRLAQDTGVLTVERQAMLYQETGEAWDNIEVVLSTARPNMQISAGDLWPQLAFLYDPAELKVQAQGGALYGAAPIMEAEASYDMLPAAPQETMRTSAVLDFQGLTAVYNLPEKITLDGDGAGSLYTIDKDEFESALTARAVPLLDSNVYAYVNFTNTNAAPYLPGRASLFRDGAYIGTSQMPMLASGQDTDIAFGSIDGITTDRIILERETGQAGVLTTSNDRIEKYRLEVENVTGREWDIVLIDRMPYSEEEALEIDTSFSTRPTTVDMDGKRGVLAWEFPLAAGKDTTIEFSYTLGWPSGKELGMQ